MKTTNINGSGVRYEPKPKENLNKFTQKAAKVTKKINWGSVLVQDMAQTIQILQESSIQYDFTDINEFVQIIYKKYTKDFDSMTQEQYQQIMKILVQKANDDHTAIRFYNNTFMYSGFTAIFDINPQKNDIQPKQSKDKPESVQQSRGNVNLKQKIPLNIDILNDKIVKQYNKDSKQITIKELKNMSLIVDVVTNIELMQYLQPGDLITHINGQYYLKYMMAITLFSERKTNALMYNLQKTALRLGMYNYFNPIKTIKTLNPKTNESFEITLKYERINPYIKFKNYSFEEYYQINIGRLTNSGKQMFVLIDKKTAYIRYPKFKYTTEFKNLCKKILKYKKDKDKSLDLLVMDMRGNPGGMSYSCAELLGALIDQSMENLIKDANVAWSINKLFLKNRYDEDVADISNNYKLSTLQKKQRLKELKDEFEQLEHMRSKGKSLMIWNQYKDSQDSNNEKQLIDVQIQQATMTQKQEIPGIVIITDQNCKSSCSIFTKLMSLFPNVIIVGRQVQGFNLSGNVTRFKLNTNNGVLFVPSSAFIFNPDITQFFQKTLNPNIFIPYKYFPTSHEQMVKWIMTNKKFFLEKISDQCKHFLSQAK